MMQTADVVIVGGAAVGSAVAHYLTSDPAFSGRVVIVERDPTYAACATALSAASIRHQFSNPVNVAMSRYGTQVLRRFKADFGLDPGFHEGGYLFLAATQSQEATLAANHAVQADQGADVVLWSRGPVGPLRSRTSPPKTSSRSELRPFGRGLVRSRRFDDRFPPVGAHPRRRSHPGRGHRSFARP
jgi:glycine/D-amino acid oxidase-like deaminating enzyme